ncbi:hypothetical protein EV360DRAFT_31619 [Lentinula raphanica]|nr:hypothetical protein EV360DRAFT_31619 [Lentinula raphanica]
MGHNELDLLSETCSTALDAVRRFRASAMKVENVLLRFFKDIEEIGVFQYMQGTTGTIISGSVALQFFKRTTYEDSDLDTYCLVSKCLEMGEWYEHIGYMFKPAVTQEATYKEDYERVIKSEGASRRNMGTNEGDDIRGATQYRSIDIAEVWNFERSDGRRIQLVATRILPEATVLGFHSTCVMNIITHRAAYSLFPRTTFKRKTTILVNARGRLLQRYERAVQKYRHRGFVVKTRTPHEWIVEDEFGFAVPRWIGDRSTWVHKIEYFGKGKVNTDNTYRVSWDIINDGPGRHNFMEYEPLFTGEEGKVAYEEGRQMLLSQMEKEIVQEVIDTEGTLQTM